MLGAGISRYREGSGLSPSCEEGGRFTPGASKGTGGFYIWGASAPLHWQSCGFHGAAIPWTTAMWCLLRHQPLLAARAWHCCCRVTAVQLLQHVPRACFPGLGKCRGVRVNLQHWWSPGQNLLSLQQGRMLVPRSLKLKWEIHLGVRRQPCKSKQLFSQPTTLPASLVSPLLM